MATVAIPGSTLQDRSGYTIEMYSRDNDGVPGGLLARGKAYLTGSAYKSVGPLGPMVVPTVAGPQGPAGPPGTPGAIWYTGAGDPIIAVANEGDMYLDTVSGNVWRWAAGSWTMV
jgi:hypothetical protein